MTQVPDNLSPGCRRGFQHGKETGPIVGARSWFDQVPAQGIPYGAYAYSGKELVITLRFDVMMRGTDHIDSADMRPLMGGTFKATHEETIEQITHRLRSGYPVMEVEKQDAPYQSLMKMFLADRLELNHGPAESDLRGNS